jgi:tRNA A37 threonylcarbamoyladenosine synthetase subunit TsaC/SUA5/YrdC
VPGFLRFADLIEQFGQITGAPVLLSTSLNVAGEPIVETPAEAIRCLLETRLDGLVIEGQIVTKTNPKLSQKIADLTREKAEQAQATKRMELELESIRGSRGWRLLTWFNRVFRPWQRPRKPNIL